MRNQQAKARHQKEVLWQITLPLILGILLFLGAAILASLGASGDISRWADATLVWLILPWLVVAFLVIAILSGLVYGVVKLIQVVPYGFFRLNEFIRRIQGIISRAGDKAVEPVLKAASLKGRLKALSSRAIWRADNNSKER